MKKYILISILLAISCYSMPLPTDLKSGDTVITSVNGKYNTHYIMSIDRGFGTVTMYSSEYESKSVISNSNFERIVVKIIKR